MDLSWYLWVRGMEWGVFVGWEELIDSLRLQPSSSCMSVVNTWLSILL